MLLSGPPLLAAACHCEVLGRICALTLIMEYTGCVVIVVTSSVLLSVQNSHHWSDSPLYCLIDLSL
jgi:hypothetical protein